MSMSLFEAWQQLLTRSSQDAPAVRHAIGIPQALDASRSCQIDDLGKPLNGLAQLVLKRATHT